MLSDIRQDISE